MVEFAGWSLPVRYSGVIEEHQAVRTAAGLFDVSHMGEFRVRGAGAEAFLQVATPNDVASLRPKRAHYSALLTERGTYLDDLLVYRLAEDEFLLVVNAANRAKDFAHLTGLAERWQGEAFELDDVSDEYALLALQGPRAGDVLRPLLKPATAETLGKLKYYRFRTARVAGSKVLLSRTGYTGEYGFELYARPENAASLWRALLEAGAGHGLQPAGLGARDTLRTEAAMALYGHEIDEETTPFEAGLGWTIKLDRGPFVGRDALVEAKSAGPGKKLIGLEVVGRGMARAEYEVRAEGRTVGAVTSGTFSPTLERAIAMAYVPPELAALGTDLIVVARGRELPAKVVELPFYKRD